METGVFNLLPLGLVLIPFFLSWRSGRRLARASYTDQLWQPLLGAVVLYAAAGLATAFVCSAPGIEAPLLASMLIPAIPAGAGLIVGARLEAGSWSRLIGVNAADWICQNQPGPALGRFLRCGQLSAPGSWPSWQPCPSPPLMLTVNLAMRWTDIIGVYQALRPGAIGGAALTLAQLAFMPNLAIWTLAWAGGDGFSPGRWLNASHRWAPPWPPFRPSRCLAALPTGDPDAGDLPPC